MSKPKNVDIVREGTKIILPANPDMPYDEAILWLSRKKEEEEQDVAVNETVECTPLDGAVALAKALQRIYGWTALARTPEMFGTRPPQLMGVKIDAFGTTIQVPWGRMQIPNVFGYLETAWYVQDGQVWFKIGGVVKKKSLSRVVEIATLTRKIAREESIYKGRAIRVEFVPLDEYSNPFDHPPEFMDLSKVKVEEMIFADDIQSTLDMSLFTVIRDTDACRRANVPLKRGILLSGDYGTGKTLCARVTAKMCEEYGWTFIYVESIDHLSQAMRLGKIYGPCVCFAEDIDRADSARERNERLNAIMNTLDGVEFKDAEVMVVLTTNHSENIHAAMLRPGRLDTVVAMRAPDAKAAIRIVHAYAKGQLRPGEDLTEVGIALDGMIPSVIREVIERAKLASIGRTHNPHMALTAEDLLIAARSMQQHLELLNSAINRPRGNELATAVSTLGKAMGIPARPATVQ